MLCGVPAPSALLVHIRIARRFVLYIRSFANTIEPLTFMNRLEPFERGDGAAQAEEGAHWLEALTW